jgi:hypothetical protein
VGEVVIYMTKKKEYEIKWHVFKNRQFKEVSLKDIVFNWEGHGGVKTVQVTRGKQYIQLMLYSSEDYTRAVKETHKGMPIILERYQIMWEHFNFSFHLEKRMYLNSKTAEQIFKDIKGIVPRRIDLINGWLTLNEFNDKIKELNEFMENFDSYVVMDFMAE